MKPISRRSLLDPRDDWPRLRRLAVRSFRSSLHFGMATVDGDGVPGVAPIGSLLLDRHEPRGCYFEIFTTGLPSDLEAGSRITVLMVDSGRWTWLRMLLTGRFAELPAARLHGTAGPRRPATDEERRRWHRRVAPVAWTRGHRALWSRLDHVRDLTFDGWEPVRLGSTTRGLADGPPGERSQRAAPR